MCGGNKVSFYKQHLQTVALYANIYTELKRGNMQVMKTTEEKDLSLFPSKKNIPFCKLSR